MALTYPYPSSGVDTRMNNLRPIVSPRQGSNRVLPTWGGQGSGMGSCSCQSAASTPSGISGALAGITGTVRAQASLGDIMFTSEQRSMMADIAPGYVWGLNAALRVGLTAAGAYHGYARNGTTGSAIGYGLLAAFVPTISMITMAVQGIAERK